MKMRLQFNENEWREISMALNKAIVSSEADLQKNKEFELMIRTSIRIWKAILKRLNKRLPE